MLGCPPSPPSSTSTTALRARRACSWSTATRSPTAPTTRCPRSSRPPTASRRTRCSASRTCSCGCSPTTSREGVIVAWDTRPVHRLERFPGYKASRKPTPSLLKQQQPYLRPLVEAFGYRNVEHEGYEADDVIGTLSLRADEQGIADVRDLARPRRVPARLRQRQRPALAARRDRRRTSTRPSASRPATAFRRRLVPDFIGLKGDTSRRHRGRAGHRRQDRVRAARALRLARGHLREHGRGAGRRSGARR